MRRFRSLALLFFCLLAAGLARHDGPGICGTTREGANGRLFLHRQALRARTAIRPRAAAAPAANRDIGDIALIDAVDGVVSHVNQFSLDGKTLAFTAAAANAAAYRFSVADQGYEAAAATAGTPLAALDDDDSREVALPFPFPFFGAAYSRVFVNSDGNLTFTAGDNASASRSVARLSAGPPRIAPLFDDLDPSRAPGGVRVLSEAGRFVVSWVAVPEYAASGAGQQETFQVKLYPDGRIEFSYSGVQAAIENAIIGIAPGNLNGATTLVDFRNDPSGEYSSAVAEWFAGGLSIDIVAAAQKFYETHEDAYDYLVIYNALGVPAMGDALAYEDTLRSFGAGYGVEPRDNGRQYGSASRLQAVMNMGKLEQYPEDPKGGISERPGDTPLSILAHEAGHLFLAFASVSDAGDPAAQPMLGYQAAHWSFYFNSDASFLEGERIFDNGENAAAGRRFVTGGTVEHYAPLDQYLMGFRSPSPSETPPTFVVRDPVSSISPNAHPPYTSAHFDGTRQNIAVEDLVQAVGRRTPDHTVAQRRFRFGFALIVPVGSDPSAAQLAQLEAYRQRFPGYFADAADNNATAETTLRRSMKLSLYPAAGVLEGTSTTATLSLQTPPAADLQVLLQAANGNASVPAAITIPAGATAVTFSVRGLRTGVEDLTAAPPAPYETAAARIQVAGAADSILKLVAVSGDRQTTPGSGPLAEPIVVRLTDANNLPYAGATIAATASPGGSVESAEVVTDAGGRAAFRWTPGPAASSQLRLELKGAPSVFLTVNGGSAAPVIQAVHNGASFTDGIAARTFETIWGVNLAGGKTFEAGSPWPREWNGVQVLLNGAPLELLYVSDNQINFYVPADVRLGAGTLAVVTPSGAQATTAVNVTSFQPGIFARAILRTGTSVRADESPVAAGDYIEIYCTGLGPTQLSGGLQWTVNTPIVFVGAAPAVVQYHGLAPGYVGLYQVNVRIPEGLAPGIQPVMISLSQMHSNTVNIAVR
jgi:uncharacterized protein (TIGR03437 family)